MTTANQTYSSFDRAEKSEKVPLTLAAVLAAVFMVDLRESLAAKSADQGAAAYAYGL
ncbi:MAG: hypothetical protein JWM30_3080 [Burkholderia sp.]|nr:hypothetical protein [Burkholderia sp.]